MYANFLLPEWDCVTCTPGQKVYRGCTTDSTGKTEFNKERLVRCPRRPWFVNPTYFNDIFWLYQNYKRGILPEGPILLSNPHYLVQCFRVIDNAISAAESDIEEERQRKARMT